MAEIKNTMDMVLERAARMAAEAPEVVNDDTIIENGMRLAAAFMNGKGDNLSSVLETQPKNEQSQIRYGMAKVLLRNIVLPRDEDLRIASERALQVLIELGSDMQVAAMAQELTQILNQYSQHKDQAMGQLDGAIRSQLQQQAMAQGFELDGDVNPAQHPQYESERAKLLTDLNGQYNDAMDERKEVIAGYFSQ